MTPNKLRAQLQRLEEQRLSLRRVDAIEPSFIEHLIAGREQPLRRSVLERSPEQLGRSHPCSTAFHVGPLSIPDTGSTSKSSRADVADRTLFRSGGKWKRHLPALFRKPIKACISAPDEVFVDGQCRL